MRNSFITNFIKEEEGFRSEGYIDTLGHITWGYGFTNITKEEAEDLLRTRLQDIDTYMIQHYYWYRYLNEQRQAVIISMVYQLGMSGFLKFKKMIAALEEEDYTEAAIQGLDSLWAKQTPERAVRQMVMLKKG